jgi:hypothetical protein
MNEKLLYLRKYSRNIEIVNFTDLSENDKTMLPDYWNKAFMKNNVKETIEIILSEWDKYDYQFKATINYLYNNLINVELVKKNKELLLLYSIKDKIGKEIYYIGKNVKTLHIPNNLKKLWDKLPDTIKDVYKYLHNGWYYFASESNGLESIENIIILSQLDWGILDKINQKKLPYKLENCISLFHNSAGIYVCYDIKTENKNNGFIWFKDQEPKNNIKLWPVIDEWTKMGIEE